MDFSFVVHFGVGSLHFLLEMNNDEMRWGRKSLCEKTWQNCASIPKVFTSIEALNDSE